MSWIFKGTPNPLLGVSSNNLAGTSTSINANGTVVAVGAPNENSGDGQVKVWRWNPTTSTWILSYTFNPPSAGGAQNYGISVSLSGDGTILAVGHTTNSTTGFVHVYRNDGDDKWLQLGNTIVPSGIASTNYERFGISVALAPTSLNGNSIVIGAPSSVIPDTNWGHAQVYTFNGTSWVTYATDLSGGNSPTEDMFGASVSMSEGRSVIAIGAPGHDSGRGAAYVYAWNSSTNEYVQRGTTFLGSGVSDAYGTSVAISGSGSTLVVGAPGVGSGGGYIKAYDWNGSTWVTNSISNDTGEANSEFGTSVSTTKDGSVIAVGARGNNSSGNTEYVRVFTNNGGSWSDVKINNPRRPSVTAFGFSVSISSDESTLSVGAPTWGDSYVFYRSGIAVCLAEGTRVLTPTGYVPVQDLKKFGYITTGDGRNVMIKHVHHSQHFNVGELEAPYFVPANVLGENIPSHDVKLSPDHLVYLGNDLWITPRGMARRSDKVVQYGLGETIHYYAIMTPNYFEDNLVIEDGVVVEAYGPRDIVYDEEAQAYRRKPKSG